MLCHDVAGGIGDPLIGHHGLAAEVGGVDALHAHVHGARALLGRELDAHVIVRDTLALGVDHVAGCRVGAARGEPFVGDGVGDRDGTSVN